MYVFMISELTMYDFILLHAKQFSESFWVEQNASIGINWFWLDFPDMTNLKIFYQFNWKRDTRWLLKLYIFFQFQFQVQNYLIQIDKFQLRIRTSCIHKWRRATFKTKDDNDSGFSFSNHNVYFHWDTFWFNTISNSKRRNTFINQQYLKQFYRTPNTLTTTTRQPQAQLKVQPPLKPEPPLTFIGTRCLLGPTRSLQS